jgi:hypothetical protein
MIEVPSGLLRVERICFEYQDHGEAQLTSRQAYKLTSM